MEEDGSLREELYTIFDLVAKRDVTLATGHVSIDEAKVVVWEAAATGVKKIIVTNPLASFLNYSVEEMKEHKHLLETARPSCSGGACRLP